MPPAEEGRRPQCTAAALVPHPPTAARTAAAAGGATAHHAAFAKAALTKENAALRDQVRAQASEIARLEGRVRGAQKELDFEKHEHAKYLATSQRQKVKVAELKQSLETKQRASDSAATEFRAKAANKQLTISHLDKQIERSDTTVKEKDAVVDSLRRGNRELEVELRDSRAAHAALSVAHNENSVLLVGAQGTVAKLQSSLRKQGKQLKLTAQALKSENAASSFMMAGFARMKQARPGAPTILKSLLSLCLNRFCLKTSMDVANTMCNTHVCASKRPTVTTHPFGLLRDRI